MKIVIAGMGATGAYLAKVLQKEGHDLILVEEANDPYRFAQEHFDAQIELGDMTDSTTLEPIIDETVDIFIALTSSDETNIVSTLIARKFGVKRAIVRINDPNNLIHPLLTDEPNVHLLNAEMIVAKDLIRLVGTPSAAEIEFFAKGKAEMVTLQVKEESSVVDKMLKDVSVPPSWIVVAVVRKGDFKIATGESEILAGDQLLVVGDPAKYHEMEELLGLSSTKVNRAILIGHNEISSKLAVSLANKGIEVRIIEKDKEEAEKAAAGLDGTLVLQGDATNEEILDEAGVEETDYLIALTEDDETNVLISLLAKEKGVSRVVALIQKPHYRKVIRKIGIDTVINPRSSMVDEVVSRIHQKDLLDINILEGGQGRMMEFVATKKTRLVGQPLAKLKLPKETLIGAILRGEQLIIPRGNTRIQADDHVVIFSTLTVFSEVQKLFGS